MKKARVCVAALALGLVGCNVSTGPNGGNGGPSDAEIVVLSSLSKEIHQFHVEDDRLVPFGEPIDLPANFDGNAIDTFEELFVTTTSAFGGSQIIFGSLDTGLFQVTTFPGPTGALADAGKPTLIVDVGGTVAALVPARAEDVAYLAFPGQPTAQPLAQGIGTFVERVLPFGTFLLSVDANLNDDGDFSPHGPPRLALHDFDTGVFFDEVILNGAVNATEAVLFGDNLTFLAGGGFVTAPEFGPAGDGTLSVVNVPDRGIQTLLQLDGNGLSLEAGRDGLGYVVRTRGSFVETDVLTFNFSSRDFVRGPSNPLQPLDSDGTALTCRVVSARFTRDLLCATFEDGAPGRLVLLDEDGTFLDDATIGVGAVDISVR